MTKTRRTYNKEPIIGGPGFKGWIKSQKLTAEDLKELEYKYTKWFLPWIGYHPYKQTEGHCKCSWCTQSRLNTRKKPLKGGKRGRLDRKEELRETLSHETLTNWEDIQEPVSYFYSMYLDFFEWLYGE